MAGGGKIRPYTQELGLLFRGIDVCLVLAALWLAAIFRGIGLNFEYLAAGALGGLCFAIIGGSRGLYSTWRLGLLRHELRQIWMVWAWTCGILLVLGFGVKTTEAFSRIAVTTWFVAAPVVLTLWRVLVRYSLRALRKSGRNTRRAVIAGAGDLGERLARRIVRRYELGVTLVGFFDDNPAVDRVVVDGADYRVLGNLDAIADHVAKGEADIVYLALSLRHEERMRRIASQLADSVASVYVAPDFFVFDLVQSRWMNLDGIPLVSLFESPFVGVTGWLKRAEDLAISAGVLLVIGVPMLVIAALVKLTSKGPVLFVQTRYGVDGRPIRVWKFRSMTVCEDGPDIPQACREDARVTPFGRFLRRTSLDELPQFINVLQGRMSVVGFLLPKRSLSRFG
jgi:putative colanic acid biosynthesis UDP-glucose lipid carrier transferase